MTTNDWTPTGVTHTEPDGTRYAQELHTRCDYEYHERWVRVGLDQFETRAEHQAAVDRRIFGSA